MQSIPNWLSISRGILALSLLFCEPFGGTFFTIYLICGITDVLDGYLARRWNAITSLGTRLDSLADLIMYSVVVFMLYPLIRLSNIFFYWILGIIGVRVLSMVIVAIKYKTFGSVHTLANKATGILLFFFPLAFYSKSYIEVLCVLASISAIEELIMHLMSKYLDKNQKSILHMK